MEVDGREYAQSNALLRYAGRLSGTYPEGSDGLFVDETIDTIEDAMASLFSYRGPDKSLLLAAREKFVQLDVPRYVGALDGRMAKMSPKGPYVAGEKISIADFHLTCFVNSIKQGIVDHVPSTCLDEFPTIMRVYNEVMNVDEVKKWYEKYPIPNVTN